MGFFSESTSAFNFFPISDMAAMFMLPRADGMRVCCSA